MGKVYCAAPNFCLEFNNFSALFFFSFYRAPLIEVVQLHIKVQRKSTSSILSSPVRWVMSSHPIWYFEVSNVNVKHSLTWLSSHLSLSVGYSCFYKVQQYQEGGEHRTPPCFVSGREHNIIHQSWWNSCEALFMSVLWKFETPWRYYM